MISAFAHCATSSERTRRFGVVSVIRRNPDGTWHGGMLEGLAGPGRLRPGVQRDAHGHGRRRSAPDRRGPAHPSIFVGDVIAGHGVTTFIKAAQAAGCKTANGGHMVEAVQDLMADFMLGS
jgi:hypothetical protein